MSNSNYVPVALSIVDLLKADSATVQTKLHTVSTTVARLPASGDGCRIQPYRGRAKRRLEGKLSCDGVEASRHVVPRCVTGDDVPRPRRFLVV